MMKSEFAFPFVHCVLMSGSSLVEMMPIIHIYEAININNELIKHATYHVCIYYVLPKRPVPIDLLELRPYIPLGPYLP